MQTHDFDLKPSRYAVRLQLDKEFGGYDYRQEQRMCNMPFGFIAAGAASIASAVGATGIAATIGAGLATGATVGAIAGATLATISVVATTVGLAMTVVGAITGDKGLMKIGGYVGLAGGVAGLASSAIGASAAAAAAPLAEGGAGAVAAGANGVVTTPLAETGVTNGVGLSPSIGGAATQAATSFGGNITGPAAMVSNAVPQVPFAPDVVSSAADSGASSLGANFTDQASQSISGNLGKGFASQIGNQGADVVKTMADDVGKNTGFFDFNFKDAMTVAAPALAGMASASAADDKNKVQADYYNRQLQQTDEMNRFKMNNASSAGNGPQLTSMPDGTIRVKKTGLLSSQLTKAAGA
jgi:hypothetical protein